jgi:hypothetical protein
MSTTRTWTATTGNPPPYVPAEDQTGGIVALACGEAVAAVSSATVSRDSRTPSKPSGLE